jgi:hypothetical protein
MPDFTQTPLNPVPMPTPMPTPAAIPARHMTNRVLLWSIITAVALGVISVLLFFYGGSSFTESGVVLTMDGPTQASVGDEIIYKVHYQNNTKSALHHVQLSFTYPDSSAIIQNGQIVNNTGNVQSVSEDDLPAGASKDEEFHSFLVGDKGNIKVALVKIDFDAGDLKSTFEKTAQLSTTISSVPIALTLVGPPTSVSGQAVTYLLDYRNQSSDDVSGLQLTFKYPDGFRVTKVSPSASVGTTVWTLPLLKQGNGNRITIQGSLTGNQGVTKPISVSLQRNINGTYIDYEKASTTTVIASPLLNVVTTVNGTADYVSHAGDTLQYSINYKNASTFTFSGLVLTAKLSGGMYDFASVDTRGGFYDSTTNTISWNSTVVPGFDSLAPGAGGTINFSVKLKSTPGSGSSNTLAHATIQLATNNVPDTLSVDQVSTVDDVLTKITSQPTFSQKMYFNDPAFGSAGSMPPKSGQATSFTIHWLVTNPGNALTGAKIVGTLPQGVTWKNVISVPAGQPQPTFNKNTSQVTWNLGTLPAGIGAGAGSAYELAFQVSLTPSPTQSGQSAPVLTGPTLSGIDSFTQQNIAVSNNDLTTSSTVDQALNGVVQ